MNYVTFIILGVLVVAIIVMIIASRTKNNKKELNKYKENKNLLISTLDSTNQHLKYKNRITMQAVTILFFALFLSLSLIFFIFLPVFQIKVDILGETIATKNFSLYDNCLAIKNAYNESANIYTDVDSTMIFIFTIASILTTICMPAYYFFFEIRTINTEKLAKKFYVNAKTEKHNLFELLTNFSYIASLFFLGTALQIAIIILCKNAEFSLKSDTHYTFTQVDNFLYYFDSKGEVMLTVFQNYFKFFNGISGYIAIPIICFIIAVVLFVVGFNIKRNLVKEIIAEKIEGFEEVTESEKSN